MEENTNSDILYEIAIDRLNAQIKTIDGIDQKIGVTFGLANGITAALIALIAFMQKPIQQSVLAFIGLSIAMYLCTLVLLFFAYRYSKWSFNPNIKVLKTYCNKEEYQNYPQIIKNWIADNCIISIEENRLNISSKLKLAYFALISMAAQGIFLSISCFLYISS